MLALVYLLPHVLLHLVTFSEIKDPLCKIFIFVIKSSSCTKISGHLKFLWSPSGYYWNGLSQAKQLNGSCANPTGSSMHKHSLPRLHFSCMNTHTQNTVLLLNSYIEGDL